MPDASHDPRHLTSSLPTPLLADAAVRLGIPVRRAPAGIAGPPGIAVAGPALPVRHSGSVDVFLEVLGEATPGDVMVIDNAGRTDEACIGDIIVHEALAAGVAGIVLWGLHRDAPEVAALGLPVFSYGTLPSGPLELRRAPDDRLRSARFGEVTVSRADVVAADANGVVFVDGGELDRVVAAGTSIRDTEQEQIEQLRAGTSLREQLGFDTYLADRARDPERTFRQHLRDRAGAVEE